MTSPRRSTRAKALLALAVGAAAVGLTGCSLIPAPATSPVAAPVASPVPTVTVTAAPPSPSATSSADPALDPGATSEPTPTETPFAEEAAMEADIDKAVSAVDGFWGQHWSEYFTGTYESPTVVGLYDGNDYAHPVTCYGDVLPADNAFYCGEHKTVQWDKTLMQTGYLTGKYYVYLVVAHEWGHAIMDQVPDAKSVAYEPQADCLAGAALAGAHADGHLAYSPGSDKEFAQSLVDLGDDYPWADTSDHGTATQRIQMFAQGEQEGVLSCLN